MHRRRRYGFALTVTLLIAALGMTPAAPAAPDGQPRSYERAYLLADSGGFLYWSFDPFEEAADAREVIRHCPTHAHAPGDGRCHATSITHAAQTGEQLYALNFYAWGRLAAPVTWDDEQPLRFRFAMDVDAVSDFTVHLHARSGLATTGSAPAVEVEPGVWEGAVIASAMAPIRTTLRLRRIPVRAATVSRMLISLPFAR